MRRILITTLVIPAGLVGGSIGWATQVNLLPGQLGPHPAHDARLWHYVVITALFGAGAAALVLLLFARLELERLALSVISVVGVVIGGFLLLSDDDRRFPVVDAPRYSEAIEVLESDLIASLEAVGLSAGAISEVQFSSLAGGSTTTECLSEYDDPTGSGSERLWSHLDRVVGEADLGGELEGRGYVELEPGYSHLWSGRFAYSIGQRDGRSIVVLETPCLAGFAD